MAKLLFVFSHQCFLKKGWGFAEYTKKRMSMNSWKSFYKTIAYKLY